MLMGLVSTPLLAPDLTPPIPDFDEPREQDVDTDTEAEEVYL